MAQAKMPDTYVLVTTLPLVNHEGGDLNREQAWEAFRQKVIALGPTPPEPEKLFQVIKVQVEAGTG